LREASRRGGKIGEILDKIKYLKASVRAKVQHPFRVIQRQFGQAA
jgi:IS5 family transposase